MRASVVAPQNIRTDALQFTLRHSSFAAHEAAAAGSSEYISLGANERSGDLGEEEIRLAPYER